MSKYEVSKSLINSNLKASIEITNDSVKLRDCETLLGIMALNEKRVTIPLENVASVIVISKRKIRDSLLFILSGIFMFIIGRIMQPDDILAEIMQTYILASIPIGLLHLILMSKKHYLVISDKGANRHEVAITFREKSKILDIVDEINDRVNEKRNN